jgi:hypothetical protein
MHSLGRIVRLQIQLAPLKTGEEPHRVYSPAAIREVPRLWMRPEGLVSEAPGGGFLLDVHHQAHPSSRNRRGENAISFGSLAACAEVRTRFRADLWDGIAGESVLLDGPRPEPEALRGGVLVRKASGVEWRLRQVIPAPPCVPFAKFALGHPESPVDPAVQKEALRFLSEGRRGFYALYEGPEPVLLELGDAFFALS